MRGVSRLVIGMALLSFALLASVMWFSGPVADRIQTVTLLGMLAFLMTEVVAAMPKPQPVAVRRTPRR